MAVLTAPAHDAHANTQTFAERSRIASMSSLSTVAEARNAMVNR